MKTKLIIEIETPDASDLKIVPEEGKSEEDYTEKELTACREDHSTGLHADVVKRAKEYFTEDDRFEDEVIENLEEQCIEGWDSFDDYGIKIKVTEGDKDE